MMPKDQFHLTEELMECLRTGKIDSEKRLQAAAHLTVCESCSKAFSESLEDGHLMQPLSPLKKEILQKIGIKNNQRNILFYDLKVILSVCASLLLLIAIPHSVPADIKSWDGKGLQKSWQAVMRPVENFREQLDLISDRLNEGGLYIEKTEK